MSKIAYHGLIIDVATGIGTEATITVCDVGTATPSSIYSNAIGTAKANPFLTDSVGRFSFFADPGEYDIQVSGALITTYVLSNVSIVGGADSYITSDPDSGGYRVKRIRLDAEKKILITYDGTPEV
jgi:hypothetical protein